MLTEEVFTIEVHHKTYNILPLCDEEQCRRFKVSTDCEYMFTLAKDNNGNWHMEKDVTPFNEEAVDEIGSAIELHEVD